jgi:molybdopterin-guanine dinucleotide biosynthesis protein A
MMASIAAYILAGGKSTRMGSDKALVTIAGRSLLARALETVGSVTKVVAIVGGREKFSSFASVVEDVFPGCGPLSGIHAALRASQCDLNLIVAVDMPFVSAALCEFLLARAQNAAGSDAIVPRAGERLQPLCAVYRRSFATLAEAALRSGHFKINPLFDAAKAVIVEEEELQAAGFPVRIFHNVNTPVELSEAGL